MPHRPYVIRQGDHLTALAARWGLTVDDVWNDPRNEALRRRRSHPNILAPGDLIQVPERTRRKHPIQPGGSHSFEVTLPRTRVSLVFRADGRAIADAPYAVFGLGPRFDGTTDGEGRAAFDVPAGVSEFNVMFPDLARTFPVRVGHLDPVEERSGVRQRLAQLGFLGHERLESDELEAFYLQRALLSFQKKCGLEATGVADEKTRAALREAHGS